MKNLSSAVLVGTNLWRITTPLPFRPREVHAYLVPLQGGDFLLVDGGLNTAEAWAALAAGVQEVAGDWSRVAVHVITHMHMDHIGLAGRVREASGARLLMGRLDAERAAHAAANPGEEAEYREALLRGNGAPEEVIQAVNSARQEAAPLAPFVPVDGWLDREQGPIPGAAEWSFVWTPGHTAGHISLFRSADHVLIGGDAVLPRVTPTIGVNRQREDPVGDYLVALERLTALRPIRIVPGHGEIIDDPARRLQELREATERETELVCACLSDIPTSAWEIARCRHESRELPASVHMLALRETLAHLQHLAKVGRAKMESLSDGVVGFVRSRR